VGRVWGRKGVGRCGRVWEGCGEVQEVQKVWKRCGKGEEFGELYLSIISIKELGVNNPLAHVVHIIFLVVFSNR
jgi:hypothetical protein